MRNKLTISILMLLSFVLLAGFASALPIEITNPTPANGATDVTPSATLAINSIVNSSNGSQMMGFMWTNISGVYAQGNWVGPFDNTTINWQMDASDYSTKYYWGVFANDSWGNDLNQSWNFTTEDETVPVTPQSTHLRDNVGTDPTMIVLATMLGIVICLWAVIMVYGLMTSTKKINKNSLKDQLIVLIVLGVILSVMLSFL